MESKRCCSSLTCCGMPMERGCFIFSIINAVLCSIGTLGSLGFLGFVLQMWLDGESRGQNEMVLLWLFTGICIASCVGSVIALIFAVVLCVGVKKNKPCYIMTYLVYGIITVVLSVTGTLVFVWMEWGEVELMMYALIPLAVCVVHSVILLLVYQTYVVLSERAPITGHRRLLNANDF